MELIGNRDPWELMFRAGRHIQAHMSALRSVRDSNGFPSSDSVRLHSEMADTHGLLIECCNAITMERWAA